MEPAELRATAADRIEASLGLQRELLVGDHVQRIAGAAVAIRDSLAAGGKLLVFGNGGSAADAQHIAGEFLGRYLLERRSIAAIALGDNVASLTAIANDYSYDDVFSRQVEGLCRAGDIALGISTSGNSRNVVAGLRAAKEIGARTVGLTGEGGGAMQTECDICICFPSRETPRIQEGHILIAHILCELVEAELAQSSEPGGPAS